MIQDPFQKKALSIFKDTDGEAIKITLDTKFKGNKKRLGKNR